MGSHNVLFSSRSKFSIVSIVRQRPFLSLQSFEWTTKLCISFIVLFQLCSATWCPRSASIHHIDHIEACNGSDFLLTFTFNVTDGLTCGNGNYEIYIYSHNTSEADVLHQAPPPVYDNLTDTCTSYLIIDDVTFQKYHDKLLQIRMYPTSPVQCSNNFTAIIGTDPPDPVNISSIDSVINCTGAYLNWMPPATPTGCDILSYNIIWNDTVVTTKEPFYYWPAAELPSNEVLTVSIEAVNGVGPSQETSINISTAIEPVVNTVNHTVIIVSSTAQLIVHTELDSDYCPFSSPNLLHICTTCNNDTSPFYSCVNLTIYNDVMVTFNITLPPDLLQCVSTLTWSNHHSSYISHINNTFSTSPVHSVFIPPNSSTGYFRINCTLLPGGSGCVIEVFNSSNFFIFKEVLTLNDTVIVSDDDYLIVSKTTTYQLTASGIYTVNVYSLKDIDSIGDVVIASSVIEVILPSPSPSPSPSLVSTSSPSHTPPPSPPPSLSPSPSQSVTPSPLGLGPIAIIAIIFASLVAAAILAVICVVVCAMYCLFCRQPNRGHIDPILLTNMTTSEGPKEVTTSHTTGNDSSLLGGTISTLNASDMDSDPLRKPKEATTRHHAGKNIPSPELVPLMEGIPSTLTSEMDPGDEAEKHAAPNPAPKDEMYPSPEQSGTNDLESAAVINRQNIPTSENEETEFAADTGKHEKRDDLPTIPLEHVVKVTTENEETAANIDASAQQSTKPADVEKLH